jgi:hypothetical protein
MPVNAITPAGPLYLYIPAIDDRLNDRRDAKTRG